MASFIETCRAARDEGGKPVLQQVAEALWLRLQRSPLGIGEYFDYGVWHASINAELRSEFIGWRQSLALDRQLNSVSSRVLANDKLITYLMLAKCGYPIPQPLATYSSQGRRIGNEPLLRNLDEVFAFLKGDVYPFYVKPISAGYGRGVMGVRGHEAGVFTLMNGQQLDRNGFAQPFGVAHYGGMLFQAPLVAHSSIATLTGTEAVSCVRFICFVTPAGPRIHTAFWKIVSGRNMLDNFSHGDFGNCLGAIDLASGTVVRAVSRLGPGGTIKAHPATGQSLIGFQLPDWEQATDLVLSASRHFPGLRLQNWDLALTDKGPVLLELNTESELNVPQAVSGRGLMDRRLREIMAQMVR